MRVRTVLGFAVAGFAVMAACDWKFGASKPNDGFGGIRYRCEVVQDGILTMGVPDTVDGVNRCVNSAGIQNMPTSTIPMSDSLGNTLQFTETLDGCNMFIVDACIPRTIFGFQETQARSLEDYINAPSFDAVANGDIASPIIPRSVKTTLKGLCRDAALTAWELDLNPKASPSDHIIQAGVYEDGLRDAKSWYVIVRNEFVDFNTHEFFGPFFGTQPLHTAPAYCQMQTRDPDVNTGAFNLSTEYYRFPFPVYDSSLQPQVAQRASAGLVHVDPNASPAIVTFKSGSESHAASTQISGELVAEKVDCTTDSSGAESCGFAVKYAALQFSDFTITGKSISNVVLRNETDGVGSTTGTVATIPAGSMPLAGQMNIEGEGLSSASFTNPAQVAATFDAPNNTFQMTLTLQSTDNTGATIFVNGTVTGHFLNRSPVAVPPPDQVVECASPSGTTTLLDGTSSFDYDGKIVEVAWRGPGATEKDPAFAVGSRVTTPPMQVGDHDFLMRVKDDFGWTAGSSARVSVVDTGTPTVTATLTPDCVWPPDHRLIQLNLGTDIIASAADQCCGDASSSLRVVNVTSSESASVAGSGNTQPDYLFDASHVCVRAERSGMDDGRTYTITLEATDCHGNKVTKDVAFSVPHDASGHSTCRSPSDVADCSLSASVSPSTPTLPTSADSPPLAAATTTVNHGGCAIGTAPGRVPLWFFFCLGLLLLRRTKMWRHGAVLVFAAFFGTAGCSSSTPSHGSSDLTVQIAARPLVHIAGDPIGFVQGQACAIQVMTDIGTAFLSGPVSVFAPGATAQIGPGSGQIALWVKTSDGTGPLSASSGTLVINQFDPTSSGSYALTIQNASKPDDPAGPSVTINGPVNAKWATPN